MKAFAVSFLATIVVAVPAGSQAGVISEEPPMAPPEQPLAYECPEPDPAGPVVIRPDIDCHDLNNVMPTGSEIPLGEGPMICEGYEATEETCTTSAR